MRVALDPTGKISKRSANVHTKVYLLPNLRGNVPTQQINTVYAQFFLLIYIENLILVISVYIIAKLKTCPFKVYVSMAETIQITSLNFTKSNREP